MRLVYLERPAIEALCFIKLVARKRQRAEIDQSGRCFRLVRSQRFFPNCHRSAVEASSLMKVVAGKRQLSEIIAARRDTRMGLPQTVLVDGDGAAKHSFRILIAAS